MARYVVAAALPAATALGGTGASAATNSPTNPPGDPLAVTYTAPPPALELAPFATLQIPGTGKDPWSTPVAVTWDPEDPDGSGAYVVDRSTRTLHVVESDGTVSATVTLDVEPVAIVAGPGVVYGLTWNEAVATLEWAAMPVEGANAGKVVVSEPLDPGPYFEIPIGTFGNREFAVVDRLRDPGAEMIPYVDESGERIVVGHHYPSILTIDADDVVRYDAGGLQWALHIDRHPDSPAPYAGESPPAHSDVGIGVYWTAIGPPADPADDLSPATMPVIAVLRRDGAGEWYSIPDGWSVVASETDGTLFARIKGERLERARLSDTLQPQVPHVGRATDRSGITTT